MHKLIVACVLASGCQWIETLRKPAEKPMELPPTARAEWVEGSFHIVGTEERGATGPALRMELWQNDGAKEAWRTSGAVKFKMIGPGVDVDMDNPEHLYWQGDWPAGTYKLTFRAFGKLVTEHDVKIALIPTGFGKPYPIVVPDGPHVIAKKDWPLISYLPTNVTKPAYSVQMIWLKDHRVMDLQHKAMSIKPLFEMGPLGRFDTLEIETKGVTGDATVFVFVNGAALYGAWSWTEAQTELVVSLPAASPDPKDLAVARAAARKDAGEYATRANPLAGPTDEALACAVATNSDARDAFLEYRDQMFGGGIHNDRESDDLNRANTDPRLTEQQRAILRKDAGYQREYGASAAKHQEQYLDKAMRIARMYKKGCLAELGVPVTPG